MYIKTSNQPVLDLGFGDHLCNWGLHLCGLYEKDEERDEIIMGFLHRGDLDGDYQIYALEERTIEDFKEEYGRRYPEYKNHIEDTNIFNLPTAKELYYPDGIFSPWEMDKNLNQAFDESQKNGPRNIRATAEMVWALEAIPGVEHLMAYESRLNYFIPGKPWVSICLYNVSKFSGATILGVLQTHPYTINGGVITQNPYYRNPDDWLRIHAPQFLNPQPEGTLL
jgi:hypothetical protein